LKFASEKTKKSLFYWSYRIAAYYLALILLKYGFDKLFKAQFNLPEPNLLYTELGQLDKDILFWSTMGVSRSYNLFMGIMEVIPALLLLFHRTRILGAFIATGVFINVLSINLSFDISVKLFTSFLLLISVYLAFPGFVDLYRFYILKRTLKPKVNSSKSLNVMILKSIIILVMVIEGLFPYLNTGNFNDDALPRPILHGAYSVENIKSLNEEFPFPAFSLERIFIHRDGYLILQDENGNMTDFSMELDQKNSMIDISDYDGNIKSLTYEYNRNKGTLILDFMTEQPFRIECKALDWRKLPLLQKQFHWTVD
jgi:hypothetical protein